MIVTDIWKGFGFGTVVYLAALSGIDPGLYESAMMDGAKRWKQTIHITIPLLMPTIILMLVLSLGSVSVSYTHLDVYKRQESVYTSDRQAGVNSA